MNDTRLPDALHLLIDLKDRLADLTQDIDRSYRPTILFLTQRNLPGTDDLCTKLQTATTAIEDLHEIVNGVTYAGPDESAFLYWEFEVKDHRNQEEAEAAMREAFSGQELADCLLLYRECRTKLPDASTIETPQLHIHDADDEPAEGSRGTRIPTSSAPSGCSASFSDEPRGTALGSGTSTMHATTAGTSSPSASRTAGRLGPYGISA